MADEKTPAKDPNESPLSLSRLREAFATMLGERDAQPRKGYSATSEDGNDDQADTRAGYPLGGSAQREPTCEINPRSVVEAILFVGRPDDGSFSSRELAAAMRGVSPGEIEAAVRELNALYEADGAPYVIEGTKSGYRLVLREEYDRLRGKFYGTVREAKLSPAALEVMSIVAYNQPATLEQINGLRGASNGGALATLVRRGLVRLDRPSEAGGKPQYSTTPRFLQLFGLEALDALPRSEELEKV